MRRATGGIRLPGRPRRLGHDECRVVLSATAALCAAYGISWRVAPDAPEQNLPHLSESLARARRDGRVFLLPPASRSWLGLRYAHPDTGYALALLLVWSYGASRHDGDEAGAGGPVAVAVWHLRMLSPPHAHRMLADVEAALVRHHGARWVTEAPVRGA
ncbi:hypothetical protein [Micromonospora haikouensis]|uniref:hypothetical protein n=1 Tax=Micromonospora haikouensis TaxID=686309 RepID=UPI001187337B|nr:hypothetical protein [Micromonospora haikouensis]